LARAPVPRIFRADPTPIRAAHARARTRPVATVAHPNDSPFGTGGGQGHQLVGLGAVTCCTRTPTRSTGGQFPGLLVLVHRRRISSAQRGRAFLGTMKGQSTVQPGPVTPLDEKVSAATLVEWAAWAASTTFSSTGRRLGYDKREVDAFRSAVRDTFLGVSGPPVKSDDVRGKQFSTHRPGYDKKQVAAFLEAAGLRLAAMESTDRPAGPLVSGALLAGWAEWADSATFSKARWRLGYQPIPVDAFREEIRDTFLGATRSPVRADDVRGTQFYSADFPPSLTARGREVRTTPQGMAVTPARDA
jgi:DivIVA domain-containing protein